MVTSRANHRQAHRFAATLILGLLPTVSLKNRPVKNTIRIKIFTLKTPNGKEQPIGIETLWSLVVDIFESRIQANEEQGVFDFIRPYQSQYDDIDEAKEQIDSYFRTTTISGEEKITMKRIFDNAETTGEIFAIFVRYRGTKALERAFPLSDNPII